MVAELERSFIRERQKAGYRESQDERGLQGTQADGACRAGSSDAQGWGWTERHRERALHQQDVGAWGAKRAAQAVHKLRLDVSVLRLDVTVWDQRTTDAL